MSAEPASETLAADIRRRAEEAGLAAVGFGAAAAMDGTRRILEKRKAAGLSAGMQFTYRNPARSTEPARLLPGAVSLVVGAWEYHRGRDEPTHAPPPASGRPTGRVARYATADHYASLRLALDEVASLLTERGWRARTVADDNALVDRAAAQRAGLGWFGKNTNILLPGRGSWFVLGSVVTDAPLPPSPATEPACGACRRCLVSCPTGALVAPGVLDARRCLAWLAQAPGMFPWEHRVALADRIYGCDDCQEVCPPNRRPKVGAGPGRQPAGQGAKQSATDATAAGHEGPYVDLLDMLAASDSRLMALYGRWYVPNRDPRYLRRNALIALGNSGRGHDDEVAGALTVYLSHADEMLRAHAVWAAFRLGRQDLVEQSGLLAGDSSALVQEELRRAGDRTG